MALGGGIYITQNKILPGAYINFVSKAVATATLTDRGVVAMGFDLDWGKDDELFPVIEEDVIKNSLQLFGYDYSSEKLNGIKDIFKNSNTLYAYRLNSGGTKASNTYCTAKYGGIRGNDLKVVIAANVDTPSNYDVSLYLGTRVVFSQTVKTAADLAENAWVDWKTGDILSATAGVPLEGGTNGVSDATSHQKFIDKIEAYPNVNAIGYAGNENTIKALYAAWVKYMRDDVGVKLQAVLFGYAADSEAVVNVKNGADVVYWATGVIGGTAVNASATNKRYDGNFEVNTDYTQSQLEGCIKSGEWVLHKVGDKIHVLMDINSLTTLSVDKGEIFQDNQTIRIIDQIATATASTFNSKYLGHVPNDADGRLSLWGDLCKIHQDLQNIRALENFKNEDITVVRGDDKHSVLVNESITVINTMTKLYMAVVVG
jgi:hypothetical protein